MFLNDDILGIEKPYGTCLLPFLTDEFSGLFLHASIFYINHLGSE